jgi:hypothetical protein
MRNQNDAIPSDDPQGSVQLLVNPLIGMGFLFRTGFGQDSENPVCQELSDLDVETMCIPRNSDWTAASNHLNSSETARS